MIRRATTDKLDYMDLGMIVRKAIVEGRIKPGPPMQIASDTDIPKLRIRDFHAKPCNTCGIEFTPQSNTAKNCSRACTQIAQSIAAKNREIKKKTNP